MRPAVFIWAIPMYPVVMKMLVGLIFLYSATVQAVEPLSKKEWALEAAFLTAGLIDYGQTRRIKKESDIGLDRWEQNKLLGRDPSYNRIRNYYLVAGLAHVGITHLLPRQYRPYWQWGTLILEVGFVARNHHIGLRVDF